MSGAALDDRTWHFHSAARYGLAGLLIWAPVPLGSNRSWAVGVMALLAWALLAGVQLERGRTAGVAGVWADLRPSRIAMALWLGLAAIPTMQLCVGGGTADPARTREYLLKTLLMAGVFLLVQLLCRPTKRAVGLLAVLVGAGVLEAVLAVGLHATGARYEFLLADFEQGGRTTGTFPNPDHLAGYMELTLSAGVGLMLAQFGGESPPSRRSWRHDLHAALSFVLSRKMLLRLMMVLLVIALVMTHSRMGNAAFFVSLLAVGALVGVVSRRLRRPAFWLVVSMTLIDLVVVGQWVGLDEVVARLQGTAEASSAAVASFGLDAQTASALDEESLVERLAIPAMAIPLVMARPWFGHGGGTFYTVFPPFKTRPVPWFWDHAHNDYAEVASDIGLVGLVLWLGLGLATAVRSVKLLRDRQGRQSRGLGAAALLGLCAMALHSMVDFNLQIPANGLTLVAMLALVWTVPVSKKGGG